MKITFQGFRLYPGDGITLPEFGDLLAAQSSPDKEYLFNEHNRLLLFTKDADNDYYVGLLITAKDQKTFPELRNEKGKLSIKVSELAEGSRLMDFNFFVIHKVTFCGVYQHYFASCSPVQFGVFLRAEFWKPEQEARIVAKIKEIMAIGGFSPAHAEASAKKAFRGSMKFDLFYKPDDYAKILKEMAEIKQFQFDVSTKLPRQSAFSPKIELKRVQHQFAFANPNLVGKITSAIGGMVKANKITKGKVVAIDPGGELRSIYLNRNIDGFGEFDFDAVTAELVIDDLANDFATCPVIQNLLDAAKAKPELFATPDDV